DDADSAPDATLGGLAFLRGRWRARGGIRPIGAWLFMGGSTRWLWNSNLCSDGRSLRVLRVGPRAAEPADGRRFISGDARRRTPSSGLALAINPDLRGAARRKPDARACLPTYRVRRRRKPPRCRRSKWRGSYIRTRAQCWCRLGAARPRTLANSADRARRSQQSGYS